VVALQATRTDLRSRLRDRREGGVMGYEYKANYGEYLHLGVDKAIAMAQKHAALAEENKELRNEVKRLDWKREENKAFAILYRKDLESAITERDRLADEIDTLRTENKRQRSRISQLTHGMGQERRANSKLLANIQQLKEWNSETLAENNRLDATLDALRDAVPEDSLDFDERHPERDFDGLESALRAILYPTKENEHDDH